MSAHLIILKCGLTDPGARPDTGAGARDAATGRMPQAWAGARTDVRLILQNPVTGVALSTAGWASLSFRLLGDDRSTLYASRTVLPADFTSGPPAETTVSLTTTETTRAPGNYWMAVYATLTAGGILPLLAGPLTIVDGGLTTTVPAAPISAPVYTQAEVDALFGPGTGGVYAADGNGLLDTSGGSFTWPTAIVGAAAGVGLTVLNGNALLTTSGLLHTWPVAEITHIPGAPLAQILAGNLIITLGGRSYTNPAAIVP
jgi:hypothetical protein